MRALAAIMVSLLLVTNAAHAEIDGGGSTGPTGSGSATGSGAVVSIGTGTSDGGPGSGADPCTYTVVSYEEAIAFLESAGVSVTPSDDPSATASQWVIVYCPATGGQPVFWGLYELGEPPDGLALAQAALAELRVPLPEAQFSPDADDFQVVGLQSWMWVEPATWVPIPATICLPDGSACATATATPLDLRVDMGDGIAVSCDGPGTAYDLDRDYEDQVDDPHCFHVYEVDSDKAPDGRYPVVATTLWHIAWTCTWDSNLDGALDASCGAGDLGVLGRQADPIPLEVRQYQAVITTGD